VFILFQLEGVIRVDTWQTGCKEGIFLFLEEMHGICS